MSGGSWLVRSGMSAGCAIVALSAPSMFLGGCSGEGTSSGDVDGNVAMPGAGKGSGVGGATSTVEATGAAAVTTTAETNSHCIAVAPFYWEIGDASGALISGSVGSTAPVASTVMAIASASKWLFGAYAVQKMGGMPVAMDVPFFNFTSGYAGLDSCTPSGTRFHLASSRTMRSNSRCPSSTGIGSCTRTGQSCRAVCGNRSESRSRRFARTHISSPLTPRREPRSTSAM
jgi:hypothetical protein